MKIFSGLLIVCLCLFSARAEAQSGVDVFEKYREKLTKLYRDLPIMSLHVQMSQDVAVAGDTIRLVAWYQKANGQSVEGDHIVQLDLVNGSGKVEQQLKFKVRNGVGEATLIVEPDLAPGYYQIVAFTTWMRNFGEQLYFRSFLSVIEGHGFELKLSGSPVASIFPEGGNLISGVWNKVLIRTRPNTPLAIVDETGYVAKQLTVGATGYAVVHLKPVPGKSYRIKSMNAPELTQSVSIDQSGVALEWFDAREEFVFRAGGRDETVGAFLLQGDRVVANKVLKINSFDSLTWGIPNFPAASNLNLLVINGEGVIIAQRQLLGKSETPHHFALTIPEKVQQRQVVRGSFTFQHSSGATAPAWVSINVFDKKLQLKSGVEQLVNNDLFIGSPTSPLLRKSLETFNKPKYAYRGLPEVSGLINSKSDGRPCPDSTLVIGFLQNNLVSYEAVTSGGKFTMPILYDFFGRDEVFLTFQARDKILDNEYDLKVLADSVNHSTRFESTVTKDPHPYSAYATIRNLASKSYFFFGKEEVAVKTTRPNDRFEEEFQGADYSVEVQKYVVFPTMVDLLREVVPFVHHRKTKRGETVRISYRIRNTTKVCKLDPLYVIDGRLTRSSAYFLSLLPQDILYLKIINNPSKLVQWGKLGENGVIIVETKNQAGQNKLPAHVAAIVGLTESKTVGSAQVQTVRKLPARVPDLRSTLYWSGAIPVESFRPNEFSFSTSDDIGTFVVQVSGFTASGEPIYFEREFRVEPGRNE